MLCVVIISVEVMLLTVQKDGAGRSGAIGQRLFPGTVMRGMRMPGHMGQVKATIQNLEIIQVREQDQLLLIKGAVPGAKGDYVIIREAKKKPQGHCCGQVTSIDPK